MVTGRALKKQFCLSISSITSPTCPHAECGLLDERRVAVTEVAVVAFAVALGDMPHDRIGCVQAIAHEGKAKSRVVPSIGLFQSPDFKNVGPAIKNGNGASKVLDLGQRA